MAHIKNKPVLQKIPEINVNFKFIGQHNNDRKVKLIIVCKYYYILYLHLNKFTQIYCITYALTLRLDNLVRI